jgi:hypothetical protein
MKKYIALFSAVASVLSASSFAVVIRTNQPTPQMQSGYGTVQSINQSNSTSQTTVIPSLIQNNNNQAVNTQTKIVPSLININQNVGVVFGRNGK